MSWCFQPCSMPPEVHAAQYLDSRHGVDPVPQSMPLQVVPSVPNLYKNSFTYHSASCVPADFQECGNFLGAPPRLLRLLFAPSRSHPKLHMVGYGLKPALCHPQTQPDSRIQRCWCTACRGHPGAATWYLSCQSSAS